MDDVVIESTQLCAGALVMLRGESGPGAAWLCDRPRYADGTAMAVARWLSTGAVVPVALPRGSSVRYAPERLLSGDDRAHFVAAFADECRTTGRRIDPKWVADVLRGQLYAAAVGVIESRS